MSNLIYKSSRFYFEDEGEVNSSLIRESDFAEERILKEDTVGTSLSSEFKIEGLDFLEELKKQPSTQKKSSQTTSSEGVYFSTGFKRTRKQIAKVIDIQSDVVVLEFVINKDLGKFRTKNFSPSIFSDLNLEINNFVIFNHFRKGNTFKIEISDNQNLISRDEIPDYNFNKFSNLFD